MLTITVPGIELYDEQLQMFTNAEGFTLDLEHSLVSLSKWESFFEKPFLVQEEKTTEEVLTYIEMMIITPDSPPEAISRLSQHNLDTIQQYIDAKMTATWFRDPQSSPRSREVITAELIYYWMIVFNVPFTCETWHLNRLFTLIKVCNLKQAKPKPMSRQERIEHNRALNARRKSQLGTRG